MPEFGVNLEKHSAADDTMLHAAGVVYLGDDEWKYPSGFDIAWCFGGPYEHETTLVITPDGREFEIWTKEDVVLYRTVWPLGDPRASA